MIQITQVQKIGVGLVGFGIALLFLGVVLFLDKGLLAGGNILFISGIACIIGLQRTLRFFFQIHKWRATVCFFGGIVVVIFLGWPLVGMVLELYGFILLFSGFFPVAVNFMRNIPVLGTFLNLPIISMIVDRLSGSRSMV